MDKKTYLDHCYRELLSIFEKAQQHKKDDKQKYRAEGFIYAGKLLGLISHQEAVDTMEKAHYHVFGESIDTRKNRKTHLKEAIARGDDSFINIPAIERSKN